MSRPPIDESALHPALLGALKKMRADGMDDRAIILAFDAARKGMKLTAIPDPERVAKMHSPEARARRAATLKHTWDEFREFKKNQAALQANESQRRESHLREPAPVAPALVAPETPRAKTGDVTQATIGQIMSWGVQHGVYRGKESPAEYAAKANKHRGRLGLPLFELAL